MGHLDCIHFSSVASNTARRLSVSTTYVLGAVPKLPSLLRSHNCVCHVLSSSFAPQIDRIISFLAGSGVLLA